MRRSTRVILGAVCLAGLLLGSRTQQRGAEEPAKKTESVKPPWQRLLQGDDAKKAAEQEEKLIQLQEAGRFAEALKVAEVLAELRMRAQGADHWEVTYARFVVDAIRRVLLTRKEEQQSYSNGFAIQREAEALKAKGRYREAQPLFEQVLSIFRNILGEKYPQTAGSYANLALNQQAQGKYKEAEEGLRKALVICREVLGEEHPDTARIYVNLASILTDQGQYLEAEEQLRKALAVSRKVRGEEHPDTAMSHNLIGLCLQGRGKYKEAEEELRKTRLILRKVLGEEHIYTAISYINLANNLNVQGKYKEAEEGHRKALAILRRLLGEGHPDTATCYNSLAHNLYAQSKYREAEENHRKALTVRRKLLGEDHLSTAKSYNNLAASLIAQGKYLEAEEGLRKALAIFRRVLGEEHPETASLYKNLAANLDAQGKYREAEEGLRKALATRRRILGEEHPDTAESYNSLAANLRTQGRYKEAEERFRKALAIFRKNLGEEHPQTVVSYFNLAANLNDQGQYLEAEEGIRKALAIFRKVLGEEHIYTAGSYNNLAINLNTQGKYVEAEEGLRKALAISRKVLGEEHLDMAGRYSNLAMNLNAQGKYKAAEQYWLLGANVFARARLHIAASGLERATKTSERSPLLSLAAVLARNGKPDEAWQHFEESLARGTWDDLAARLRRPRAERDKQTQINIRIDRLNQHINTLNTTRLSEDQSKQRDEMLSQLRQAYDELSAFNRQLEKKYGPVAGEVFSHSQIQVALPEDTVLLAWLDIPGQAKAADPNGEHWAILLRSSGDPVWVRMKGSGDNNVWTDADTRLPGQLRAALQNERSLWHPLAERLRKQRFDPLAEHLKGVRRLIVLPSTALAGVPIEVIADGYTVSYAHSGTMYAHLRQPTTIGKGLFVLADPIFDPPAIAEKPQPLPPSGVLLTFVAPGANAADAGLRRNDVLLRYGDTELSGPKDFKPQPASNDPEKRVAVVVWREGKKLSRPVFVRPGKLGVAIAQEPAPQAMEEQRRWDRKLASRSGDDGNWDRLPGTRFEAASLQRLFDKDAPFKLLLDSDASEERLNELAKSGELGKYRYLHLATHGEVNDSFPLRSAVILSRDHLPDDKQRTDLLVAGQPIPDGRLEAEEALQRWNLHCDLVTLSACETALGKYERGEGFVGFAQSLILCGTRSVCLSLWKVSDTATALLMERFYQNLLGKRDGLKGPMPKAAALAEAKTWLRNLSREEAVKHAASLSNGVDRGKRPAYAPLEIAPAAPPVAADKSDRPFAHPYYWAAFVLVGHAD